MKRSHSVIARSMVAPPFLPASTPTTPAATLVGEPPEPPAATEATQAAMPFPGPYAHVPPPVFANPIVLRSSRRDYPPLILAAYEGDQAKVDALLAQNDIDINQLHVESGGSALITAAKWGHLGVVVALLDAGADVNAALLTSGVTALLLAAANGHVDVVRALLAHGELDVAHTVANGRTALHLAALNNHPDVVRLLLDHRPGSRAGMAGEEAALAAAVGKRHAAVIEVFMEHGADLPGFDFFAPGADAYSITVADLHASHRMPVARQLNPLGLLVAPAPDQLHPCLQKFIEALDARRDLLHWLRDQGIRMACAVPVARCLASYQDAWEVPDNHDRTQNARQKQVYCVYALSRLRVLTADGHAVQAYQSAGISSAGAERLTVVARRQIDALVAVADQALQTLRARMLQNLVQDCLAKTTASFQIDVDALAGSLTNTGFFSSLAQGIAVSWKRALVALESEPVVVPAGLTMKQTVQYLREHTARKAPEFFSRAITRELDRQPRHTARGPWPGNTPVSNDLDALFQIQCAQLRQYCRQLLQMNQAPPHGAAGQ